MRSLCTVGNPPPQKIPKWSVSLLRTGARSSSQIGKSQSLSTPTLAAFILLFLLHAESLDDCSKCRYQRLRQPEAEHELRAGHEKLGRQSFEETGDTLVLNHAADYPEPTLRVLEISVLDTGFDDIEGSRDDEGGRGTAYTRDEILQPTGFVVVLEGVNVLLGEGRSTKELSLCQWCFGGSVGARHTAKDPGAFLAAVHPAPRYRPMPSSATMRKTPRPRKASGFVCRLIFKTSRGSRMISPMPIRLPAVACMMALPVPLPKALSNSVPWCCAR